MTVVRNRLRLFTSRHALFLPALLLCALISGCGDGPSPGEHIAEARRILDESRNLVALERVRERRIAIGELKQALKKDSGNLEAATLLGMTLYADGALEDSDHWLSKALALGADHASITPLRAQILLVTEQLDKLDSLSFAGLGPEGRSTVQAAKAVSMLEQGRPELATETIEAALQNEPHSPFAEVAAARITMGTEGYDAARRELLDILDRYPDYVPAWYLLGDVESARGQAADALKAYKQYIDRVGMTEAALLNSALMHIYNGKFAQARNALQILQGQYKWVRDIDSYRFVRGLAYLELEDTQSAYRTFVDIYGQNTNYRDVADRVQELGHSAS